METAASSGFPKYVILMSILSCIFMSLVSSFISSNNVKRLIMDECHELLISESFQPRFLQLWKMALQNCQLVHLTATLPTCFESLFMEKTALHPFLTHWIRGETNRSELHYHVAKIDSQSKSIVSVIADLARKLESSLFCIVSRGIIFISSFIMVMY